MNICSLLKFFSLGVNVRNSGEAAVRGKRDNLEGLKENVIVGHLIPAGTGRRSYQKYIVGGKGELETEKRKAPEVKRKELV